MANITLFPKKNLTDFAYIELFDAFGVIISPAEFVLELGKTYIVEWDEAQYVCEAQDGGAIEAGAVGIGNLAAANIGDGNDEPFIIGYIPSIGLGIFSSVDMQPTAHTLSIVLKGEADVILRDYKGGITTYEGVEKVALQNTDGGITTFTRGSVMPPIGIDLDFTNGDQTVKAPDGYLVKEATIHKPEALIPNKIAEGINIAGIIGTLAGGGGESNVKIAYGTFVGNGGTVPIEHNLGKIPDLIIVILNQNSSVTGLVNTKSGIVFLGISESLKNAFGMTYAALTAAKPNGTTSVYLDASSVGYLNSGNTRVFYYVNDTKFSVGSEYVQTASGKNYAWIAISGLT